MPVPSAAVCTVRTLVLVLVLVLVVVESEFAAAELPAIDGIDGVGRLESAERLMGTDKLVATAVPLTGLRLMVVVAWLVTTGRSVDRDKVVVWPSGTV